MLKKMLNEMHIKFNIEVKGPLLIKKGDDDPNNRDPEMTFVKDANGNKFIPGSSIKGIWRSWCEKIARTISTTDVPLSCNPLEDKDALSPHLSCSKRLEKEDIAMVYSLSCPVCKIFGNTVQGSRIKISDAYPKTTLKDGKRTSISIDRFTGGVAHGHLFSYNYVIEGTFETNITIKNFEFWHIGLLAYLLRDFQNDLVPIGFGKTRGFGRVHGKVDSVTINYFGLKLPSYDESKKELKLWSVGNQYNDKDKNNYCFANESPLLINDISFTVEDSVIKRSIQLKEESSKKLFNECSGYWAGLNDSNDTVGYFDVAQKQREDIINKGV